MITADSGRCSFCGKKAGHVSALVGAVGRTELVCNECVEICLEILRDDLIRKARHDTPSEGIASPPPEEFEITEMVRRGGGSRAKEELAALMGEVQVMLSRRGP